MGLSREMAERYGAFLKWSPFRFPISAIPAFPPEGKEWLATDLYRGGEWIQFNSHNWEIVNRLSPCKYQRRRAL